MINNHRTTGKRYSGINRLKLLPFTVSLFSIFIFLYDIGFKHTANISHIFSLLYIITLSTGAISIIVRYFGKENRPRLKAVPFDLLLLFYLLLLVNQYFKVEIFIHTHLFEHLYYLYIALFLVFFRESSVLRFNFKRNVISPAQLFIYSFLIIIIIGALLLMLPSATNSGISFIDALFTSTSAVCVTGLTVVETGSYFTGTGQFIILLLIQIGGIGIMTFASYFSFFFRGVSSYENQLVIKEITNTDKLGEVFSILKKIILVTFLIEGMGAFLIYHSVGQGVISDTSERVFFSIFHSVSGFCNAGFSTLNNSFSGGPFQFNYPFLLIISALIVVGGLGFPIVFNLLKYISVKTLNLLKMVFTGRRPKIIPWIININTRIILITTLILIASGMVLFFIFEYNNTLSGHNFLGKLTISVFSSVTSRTAGFSSVEIPSLGIPATLIIALLMWIGASPGSTGGGIKTSTFAIAILNIFTIARGKSRLELFKREISTTTVNRAFAIIILSVLIIFTSVFLITLFDPDLGLFNIVFECISAYSTTGLSRGITPDLSAVSKFVLIVTMFIGRVSMLTILIALFKKSEHGIYRYPSENILIN